VATTIVGLKIRETRRALGISQSELARQMGISPAYLNLIEFSKRRIGGRLLKKAADCLDLQTSDLDGAAELRLIDEIHEIAVDPTLRAAAPDPETIEAFVGRFPDWAGALAELHRSERANRELATALSDRLTHDPYLG
jgi:transcriptional regulator with XRE-family HTH domain